MAEREIVRAKVGLSPNMCRVLDGSLSSSTALVGVDIVRNGREECSAVMHIYTPKEHTRCLRT